LQTDLPEVVGLILTVERVSTRQAVSTSRAICRKRRVGQPD
jgi:hypothetical protein